MVLILDCQCLPRTPPFLLIQLLLPAAPSQYACRHRMKLRMRQYSTWVPTPFLTTSPPTSQLHPPAWDLTLSFMIHMQSRHPQPFRVLGYSGDKRYSTPIRIF